jgi:hypothetical protein
MSKEPSFIASYHNPVMDGPGEPFPPNERYWTVRQLLWRINYKEWRFRVRPMGDGHYVQVHFVEHEQPWAGRKWYVSPYATDAEIISTAFKAILTAEEHEAREQFLFDGIAIFGPHLSLHALKANAGNLSTRP